MHLVQVKGCKHLSVWPLQLQIVRVSLSAKVALAVTYLKRLPRETCVMFEPSTLNGC